jgi:hypothetical protein
MIYDCFRCWGKQHKTHHHHHHHHHVKIFLHSVVNMNPWRFINRVNEVLLLDINNVNACILQVFWWIYDSQLFYMSVCRRVIIIPPCANVACIKKFLHCAFILMTSQASALQILYYFQAHYCKEFQEKYEFSSNWAKKTEFLYFYGVWALALKFCIVIVNNFYDDNKEKTLPSCWFSKILWIVTYKLGHENNGFFNFKFQKITVKFYDFLLNFLTLNSYKVSFILPLKLQK